MIDRVTRRTAVSKLVSKPALTVSAMALAVSGAVSPAAFAQEPATYGVTVHTKF